MDKRLMALASLGLAGALGVILYLTLAEGQPVFWFSVVVLGALLVICETLGEKMTGGGRSTYGMVALFAAIAALNTPSAMIVALFGAFHLRLLERRDDPWRMAATAAMYSLCTWAAAAVYHALGGASRAFTINGALRSLAPLLVAAAVFWCLNALLMSLMMFWLKGSKPDGFLRTDALRLFPNQIIYAFIGLGMGIIYAQNAFDTSIVKFGLPGFGFLGNEVIEGTAMITGSVAKSLRALFAMLSVISLLGVAWYFSGKNIELLEAYDRSMEVLLTHLEKREPYLDGHAVRVADYAALIAKRMRFPLYEVNRLRHAALMHDLGRPAIPLEVLLQPLPLSKEEFEKVKAHPLEGGSRLEEVEYLADMAEAARHHHEYYDGGGYIDGLSGETIPLSARIIAVADAYDSMLNRRPWRESKGPERALAELRQNSGRQFDPEIVEHFIAALEAAKTPVGDAAEAPRPAAETVPRGEKGKPADGKRRVSRREEMLMRRREERELLEREALRELEEEEGAEGGPAGAREGRDGPEPPGGGSGDGGGEAR